MASEALGQGKTPEVFSLLHWQLSGTTEFDVPYENGEENNECNCGGALNLLGGISALGCVVRSDFWH